VGDVGSRVTEKAEYVSVDAFAGQNREIISNAHEKPLQGTGEAYLWLLLCARAASNVRDLACRVSEILDLCLVILFIIGIGVDDNGALCCYPGTYCRHSIALASDLRIQASCLSDMSLVSRLQYRRSHTRPKLRTSNVVTDIIETGEHALHPPRRSQTLAPWRKVTSGCWDPDCAAKRTLLFFVRVATEHFFETLAPDVVLAAVDASDPQASLVIVIVETDRALIEVGEVSVRHGVVSDEGRRRGREGRRNVVHIGWW
jgi:hypothetical protein